MNKNDKDFLGTAPIGKLLLSLALPTITAQLINMLYNIVDRIYIGHIPEAGALALTGVGVCMPLILIVSAFAALVGSGGAPRASILMGKQEHDQAEQILGNCFALLFLISIVLTVILLAWNRPILLAFGASENTIDYARDYLFFIALGAPFIMFGTAFGNILRGEGAARESMIGNLIGTIVNIVLDPIMMLVLGWGVVGAAVATVIGNMAASLFYLGYFLRKRSSLSINIRDFKLGENIPFSVASIGIPASLNNILMSCANMVLNQMLASYGDTPVAAMGVATKVNMLVVLLQIGLCAGIQPLIGYNYGARNKKRLMQVFRFSGLCAVIMGTVLTLLMVVARQSIIRMFINDADVVNYGIRMIIALQLSGPVMGILFLCINTIQGMGKALPSLILTICRQGLVFIPLILVLNRMFGLDGVIYAQPAADYISIVLSVVICMLIFKNMEHVEKEDLIDQKE